MSDLVLGSMPTREELELTAAATSAERSNQPRIWLWLTVLVLLGAIVYLASSGFSLLNAHRLLGQSRQKIAEVNTLMNAISAEEARDMLRTAPVDNFAGRTIERYATDAGLGTIRVADQQSDQNFNERGMRRKRYVVPITNADPQAVLTWLSMIMSAPDLRGLELTSLSFRPDAPQPGQAVSWKVDVNLGRWERQ